MIWSKPGSKWFSPGVDNQHRLIAELEKQGRDAEEAIELPKQFIEAQELWEREQDRLVTKLATVC